MKAVIEPLEGNKVKLSIEVDEAEFENAIDAAFRKIAREVRIPGFRPGRAPRRILEARLGKESGRVEALRDSLPDFYARAIRDNEVDAIAPPEIDITSGTEDGPVLFEAVVEVRPHLHLEGYGALQVTIPSPEVTEEDIAGQIDRLRGNFGELSEVERPAERGDHLTIDLDGSRDGEPVPGMTTTDFVYELGSNAVLPELDDQLVGATTDETKEFDVELPDGAVHLKVTVKDVKEKVLPEVTDEWAGEASEFDSVEELRADIVGRLANVKRMQATMALRNGTVEALIGLVESEPPKALVDAEVERQAHELGHRLEAQGATLAQYLEITGQSQEDVVAGLRAQAEPSVKADLALRSVAESEKLEASEGDVDEEIARLAAGYETTPGELRRQIIDADQLPSLRSDIQKNKALEWLVAHAEVVDADGASIDRAALEAPVEDPPGAVADDEVASSDQSAAEMSDTGDSSQTPEGQEA